MLFDPICNDIYKNMQDLNDFIFLSQIAWTSSIKLCYEWISALFVTYLSVIDPGMRPIFHGNGRIENIDANLKILTYNP